MALSTASLDPAFVTAFRSGTLTAHQADAALPSDRAAIVFLLLQLSVTLAAGPTPANGPHTPSSTVPPYDKPNTPRRRKSRGGQPGHPGHSRPKPTRIDRREEHTLTTCPNCGGPVQPTAAKRTRVIEDIPDDLKTETVEHTIHRSWCPCCRKPVEPTVPDALPQCTLGHRTTVFAAWLYYGLAVTISQIVAVFNHHLQVAITAGGLLQMWHRLADVFEPWYEQIHRHCLEAGVLHADETGWRVEGETWWLWCFSTSDATCYQLDRSRGHPALEKFFTEAFDGILVSDFWAAYDAIGRYQQKCWPHLLRDLKAVQESSENDADWPNFYQRLRRVYGDAIRLVAARPTLTTAVYDLKLAKLQSRLTDLAATSWTNAHAQRLAKRLAKYGDDLLTFVEFEGVPSDNNHAEREIRPAVLMRKASYGNQSEAGAATRAVLMTIFRTLKRRGHDPLKVMTNALRHYTTTGQLPPLPEKIATAG